MWHIEDDGNQYSVEVDQSILFEYVNEALLEFRPFNREITQYCFLKIVNDFIENKRTIHELSLISNKLLYEYKEVNTWKDNELTQLLDYASDSGYRQHKADEGDAVSLAHIDKVKEKLKAYLEKNREIIDESDK